MRPLTAEKYASLDNTEHRHSAIRFITPDQHRRGVDTEDLETHRGVYEATGQKHTERWSGNTRYWSVIEEVVHNASRGLGGYLTQHGPAATILTPGVWASTMLPYEEQRFRRVIGDRKMPKL